jgi:1,4-dihydroxy-6-naphthoate synthase
VSAAPPLRVGLSTCPNDTFAFAGLLAGEVRLPGRELRLELADVEELNRRVLAGALDASKASFALALEVARDWVVLETGSALGFGVGPLLVERPGWRAERRPAPPRVLSPGAHTTAFLLWRLFHAGREPAEPRQVLFSSIVPALQRGEAEQGLLIHEGRFTWQGRGLGLVEDLGERWERESGLPLPLGGILARRELGPELHRALAAARGAALARARAHPERALESIRAHAQELGDGV